jgi:hypothetical protein
MKAVTSYEHSNKLKCHVKGGTYTDQLRNYLLLNKYFVTWSLSIVIKEPHFSTCTVLILLFCTMAKKCTYISQIITLLHVLTISCNPQGACNQ